MYAGSVLVALGWIGVTAALFGLLVGAVWAVRWLFRG